MLWLPLGRFKGRDGERLHLLFMVPVTHSGMKIRCCLEWLVTRREEQGLFHGPPFVITWETRLSQGSMKASSWRCCMCTRIGRGHKLRMITSCWKVLTSMSATESFDLSTEAPSLGRKGWSFGIRCQSCGAMAKGGSGERSAGWWVDEGAL
jgi:hypothetical protein